MKLEEIINQIKPMDAFSMISCKSAWNNIAKPVYGMGKMEDLFMQLAGIYGTDEFSIEKKALAVFCGDSDIVKERVTQNSRETSSVFAAQLGSGTACAGLMAKKAGADVFPIDISLKNDTPKGVEEKKVCRGTRNFCKEEAMSEQEVTKALEAGMDTAITLKEKGYEFFLAGELGSGSTTAAAALAAALLGKEPKEVVGKGSGISLEQYKNKLAAVESALSLHNPDAKKPKELLQKIGSGEIAALAGFYLGAASVDVPVLMDGFVSMTAALIASRFSSLVRSYVLPSHMPGEPGASFVMEALCMEPLLRNEMRLSAGCGALMACPVYDMAQEVFQNGQTFEQAGMIPFETDGCH